MGYISEDYCSEELSGMLMEKGYIGATNTYFGKDDINVKQITLQSAMKWLREVHNLHIMVDCIGAENYMPTIQFTRNSKDIEIKSKISKIGGNGFDSYEEACETAIKYCLENLI